MRLRFFAAVACLSLVIPALVSAQTASTGAIVGVVSDPSGAVIAGAEVKLLDTATGVEQKVTTNAAGQYTFPRVSPGTYDITVTMEGFRTTTLSGLKVAVARSYNQDFSLELGTVAQTVEVAARSRCRPSRPLSAIQRGLPPGRTCSACLLWDVMPTSCSPCSLLPFLRPEKGTLATTAVLSLALAATRVLLPWMAST